MGTALLCTLATTHKPTSTNAPMTTTVYFGMLNTSPVCGSKTAGTVAISTSSRAVLAARSGCLALAAAATR